MSEPEFVPLTKRESLMSSSYFDSKIEYIEKIIQERLRKLRDQPTVYTEPEVFLQANFRNSYQLLFLEYSRGTSIDSIKSRFASAVSSWEQYQASPKSAANDFASIDYYVISFWLFGFAVLFDIDRPLLDRLLKCIGNEGKDLLFERLVATRVPGRKRATALLYPKPWRDRRNGSSSDLALVVVQRLSA